MLITSVILWKWVSDVSLLFILGYNTPVDWFVTGNFLSCIYKNPSWNNLTFTQKYIVDSGGTTPNTKTE